MTYSMSTTLDRPYDQAVADVRAALAEQGFGVITEIDMQAALKEKIGADIEPQIILGACSPSHAYRALQAEPSVGVLLPCNVVVRAEGADRSVVEMINPQMMVEIAEGDGMQEVADEVTAKLSAALDSL